MPVYPAADAAGDAARRVRCRRRRGPRRARAGGGETRGYDGRVESRTPPQNLEAEQSVLGSILLDNEVYATLEGMLQPEHFYKEGHRKIFRAITRLFRRGEPMDLVTLTEELRQSNELESVGSVAYLIGLADSVPTAAYAENYARIVVEKATLRELISASGQIMQAAYDQSMPVAQILDKAESGIFEVTTHKRSTNFLGMGPLVSDTFAYINELFTNPDPVTGLRMGFKELDSMTAGLQPSSLNVLAARPSMGKCLGAGTRVIMADGRLCAVEELQVGDEVLGPDSEPRRILSLARGREPMYWVRQEHGIDYRVNESHVLSLKRSRSPRRGEVVNIPVHAWLACSAEFRNDAKGWKTAIELPERDVPVEPYVLGLWLGDGCAHNGKVTTAAPEVVAYLHEYAEQLGSEMAGSATKGGRTAPMHVTVDAQGDRTPMHGITRGARSGSADQLASSLQGMLAGLGVLGDKHIPDRYLRNARPVRLELLAGLIDSEGHYLSAGSGSYEITTKLRPLAEQIKWLCDSLGYRTSLRSSISRIEPLDYEVEVYRVRFNGDVDEIPVRVPSKKASPWTDARDWRVTGIEVEADGVGDYYGFTLDRDGLFLLEDMTVTHNTAFALTIGQNVGLREGKTVAIFNLEMSAVQLVTRMLCSEARVDMSRVRNGHLSERDFQRLADTAGRMSEARIFIDDAADLTVMELRSRARRLMTEHDLGLIIIDYLQLMSGGGRFGMENRQQEISSISRGLKMLARELDIPVLVLSQLSRAVESRPNKRPMLSDLRECVTGDTLVVLADGRRAPIRELVGTTPDVVAMAPDGKLIRATSDKVWRVGEREIFEVRLASGRSIRATAKHRLFGYDGWKRIGELEVGQRVAISRRLPQPDEAQEWPEDRLLLLGHLIGDGSYLSGQPMRYCTSSEVNSEAVAAAARREFGAKVKRYAGRGSWHQLLISGNGSRWHPAGVNAWLRGLGVFNQRSHEKRVPRSVFLLGDAGIATLLRHLWAADGSIHVRTGKGSHRVYYSTTSNGLASDVAALLLRLGIVARIKRTAQGTHRMSHHVDVCGARDQRRFLDVVGGFGPRAEQAEALQDVLANVDPAENVDTVPVGVFSHVKAAMAAKGISHRKMAELRGTSYGGSAHFRFAPSRRVLRGYATLLESKELAAVAESDLFWDRITSITPAGVEDVYDVTVPGPASWLADGIVSHNSGAIEQDADLVMFIYRDEYYDRQSEKQGIAEIIIGKQRNGPVGTIELQFHNAHVRFNDLAKTGP